MYALSNSRPQCSSTCCLVQNYNSQASSNMIFASILSELDEVAFYNGPWATWRKVPVANKTYIRIPFRYASTLLQKFGASSTQLEFDVKTWHEIVKGVGHGLCSISPTWNSRYASCETSFRTIRWSSRYASSISFETYGHSSDMSIIFNINSTSDGNDGENPRDDDDDNEGVIPMDDSVDVEDAIDEASGEDDI
ncbi:Uncharacterized protein TCM_024168 [Theobroma cacao]|uniref:Uncharacterized protein n=1 Tax=Theobroma cacao TaxID=3641 RepID=A0A061EUX4_THECC|nr:Uncharacterized protein TCM_024168 [Theobroma cacao]